jgi:SH3-like domain-containing protein
VEQPCLTELHSLGPLRGADADYEDAAPRPSLAPPTLAPPSTPAPVVSAVIGATGGTSVNLRTGPSTGAPVVATLAEGTPVEVLDEPVPAEGRSWQRIRSGDHEGWVVAVVVQPR